MDSTTVDTESGGFALAGQLRSGHEPVAAEKRQEKEPAPGGDVILRFHSSERRLHWAVAVPFLTCAVSGLILLFGYNLTSDGISRNVFAGLHRIGGLALLVLPARSLLRSLVAFRIHLRNVRIAFTWTRNDLKWVLLAGPAAVSRKLQLPDQHKFNAAEKVNFIAGLITYPVFAATGILLLLPGTNFLAWVIHVAAALLVVPLILGHIFMAVANPSTRPGLSGMFSGYVDREWARHHYRTWYQETCGREGLGATPCSESEPEGDSGRQVDVSEATKRRGAAPRRVRTVFLADDSAP